MNKKTRLVYLNKPDFALLLTDDPEYDAHRLGKVSRESLVV